MPHNEGGFGDLHVHVRLRLPEQLNDAHRTLFEQLRIIESATSEPKSEDTDSTNVSEQSLND